MTSGKIAVIHKVTTGEMSPKARADVCVRSRVVAVLCLQGALLACEAPSLKKGPVAPSSSSSSSSSSGLIPFVLDRVAERFAARVIAVEPVRGYTYVLVETNADGVTTRRQLVSLSSTVVVGDWVDVAAFGVAEGFVSKQLGRTFERLWFVVLTPSKEHAS